MATFRVERNKNYTVMSNYHLKDRRLSLKAKGLLSIMLSLSDEWHYSIAGLVAISKENETAIKSTLTELKQYGYLVITKKMPNETDSGRIEYEYNIYEHPQETPKQEVEKQGVENLPVESQGVENQGQLNTNTSNTKESNTKEKERKKGSAKKKAATTYDEILSGVQDESLRATYQEFIKMRTLMKKPMTNHALELLVKKVNDLEPNDTSRQIKLLETAIERNWLSVYPLKDDGQSGNNSKSKSNDSGKWCLGTNADDEPYPF